MPLSGRAAESAAFRGAILCAAVFCTSGLALLFPVVGAAIGRPRLGHVVFWGLPLLAGLLAAVRFRNRPADPAAASPGTTNLAAPAASRWRPTGGAFVRLLPFCAAAFACDQGFLGIGHLLGWITFTFGEQRLVSHPLVAAAWGLPLCLLVGVVCYERALRGRILAGAADRFGIVAAATVSGATGLTLALPGILLGTSFPDRPYVAAAVVTAVCREAASCVIFLSGGGILLAGLYRGWLLYFEGFVLNDVNALFFPMANYTSSEPRLYLLRAGLAVAGAATLALGGAWVRRRAARA